MLVPLARLPTWRLHIACVAGVEGEGKGKKPAREARERFSRGRLDPFPPFLRPATQASLYTKLYKFR